MLYKPADRIFVLGEKHFLGYKLGGVAYTRGQAYAGVNSVSFNLNLRALKTSVPSFPNNY